MSDRLEAPRSAFVRQWNVLAGFCARDWSLHFRSPLVVVGTLTGPLLLLVAVGIGLGGSVTSGQQNNILGVIVPGLCAMSTLLVASQRSIAVFHDRSTGLIDEIVAGPVSRLAVIIAQSVSSASLAAVHGLIMLLLTIALGAGSVPDNLPAFVGSLALFAVMSSVLCNAMAHGATKPGTIQSLLNLVVNPMFFLSGALYDVAGTAPAVRLLALIDPLHYGVRLLQSAYGTVAPASPAQLGFSIAVIIGVCLLGTVAAVRFSRRS